MVFGRRIQLTVSGRMRMIDLSREIPKLCSGKLTRATAPKRSQPKPIVREKKQAKWKKSLICLVVFRPQEPSVEGSCFRWSFSNRRV